MNEAQIDEALLSAEQTLQQALASPAPAGGVDPRQVAPLVDALVQQRLSQALASIPAIPGAPGKDGMDGPSPGEVAELVRAEVAKIPKPKDGRDGKPGKDGKPGTKVQILTRVPENRGSSVEFTPYENISARNVQDAIKEEVDDLAASTGSSLVGFIQSGSGAVSRTMQAKAREIVSVTDFGAVGDNATDDTTAWANCITAVGVGGTIFAPALNYLISDELEPLTGQQIIGEGLPSNTLTSPYVPTAGQSTFIRYTGASGFLFNLTGVKFAKVKNIAATAASTSGGVVLLDNAEHNHISDLLIRNVPSGTGVKLINSAGGVYYNHIENVTLFTSVGTGVWLASGGSAAVNDNFFTMVQVTGAAVGTAMQLDTGFGNRFVRCALEPAATTCHLKVTGGIHHFEGLRVEGTAGTAGHIHITGGSIRSRNHVFGSIVIRDAVGASDFDLPDGMSNLIPDPLFAMNTGSYPKGFALSTGSVSTGERSTTIPGWAYRGASTHIVSSSGTVVDVRYRIVDAAVLAAAEAAGQIYAALWVRSESGTSNGLVLTQESSSSASTTRHVDRTGEWQLLMAGISTAASLTAINLVYRLGATGAEAYFYAPMFYIAGKAYRLVERPVSTFGDTFYGMPKIVQGVSTGELVPITAADIDTTQVQNVNAGEDNLMFYPMPAGAFSAAGKGVMVKQHGTFANNANAKTLKAYFGATAIVTLSLPTGFAGEWRIEYECIATGTDAQDYSGKYIYESADGVFTTVLFRGTLTENDGAQIGIKCTGEATTSGDIIQHTQVITFIN